MRKGSTSSERHLSNAKKHSGRWKTLVDKFLPVTPADTIWCYSRLKNTTDVEQGWKLHISANILNATDTLAVVGPYLTRKGVLFKAPRTLQELQKLNSGLYYGYSQVGKLITVYPQSSSQARSLAFHLHRLTQKNTGPTVPFEERLKSSSNVYYRYGSFAALNIEENNGEVKSAIRDPDGNLIVDDRYTAEPPKWTTNPFSVSNTEEKSESLDSTPYRIVNAITQRGKGGVYQAIDFSVEAPRWCVIKQARQGGEVQWNGRDATWLLKNEAEVLGKLAAAGVEVPRIYSKFLLNRDHYLVLEHIDGDTLENRLAKRHRRLPIAKVVDLCIKIGTLLGKIHKAGWIWRDCKPANLIITNGGDIRPLDFEGAAPIDRPDWLVWQTKAFLPPLEKFDLNARQGSDDVYSLGVICYFLLTGTMPDGLTSISVLRERVPRTLEELVTKLMSADPNDRPKIPTALAAFSSF
jgi:hypothetical protein